MRRKVLEDRVRELELRLSAVLRRLARLEIQRRPVPPQEQWDRWWKDDR